MGVADVMHALDTVRKDAPAPSGVHVNGVLAGRRKKRRIRYGLTALTKQMIGDAAGAYIGRRVLNEGQLREWWSAVRLPSEPTELDPSPHVTLIYSDEKQFDWEPDPSLVAVTPDNMEMGLLGAKNAVVLFLDAPLLESRFHDAVDHGAMVDFPEYVPHVTLFYLGADNALSRSLPLPDFPLLFGPEICGSVSGDVFEAVQAPAWYHAVRGVATG